jgi:CheY-like chemotaxis protein
MPRLLLVDADIDACNALARLLRAVGYCVDCAYSGAAAIDHLTRLGAEAVIVDLNMPQLDGWNVLRWTRERPPHAGLPVIVHSELCESHWKLARKMGANELWVRGTCSFDAICDSLEQYCERTLVEAA